MKPFKLKQFSKAVLARLNRALLRATPRTRRFHRIYKSRAWSGGNGESISGAGSTLRATNEIRRHLPEALGRLNCRVLLDLGCGDFNWMKEVQLPCYYIGADIVDNIIKENHRKYSREDREFIVLDAASERLPPAIDVVLCREVLFHLSNADIKRALSNIKKSDAQFFVATNMEGLSQNVDTFTGVFRQLDLCLAPFHFPAPIESLPDQGIASNRYLCVWQISDLP